MSRPFADVLRELNGDAYDAMGLQLGEVVSAVCETLKTGSITVSLKVAPNGKGAVTVSHDIKAKIPEAARPQTTFFATSSGSLLRRDPNQSEMQLRDVSEPEEKEMRHA